MAIANATKIVTLNSIPKRSRTLPAGPLPRPVKQDLISEAVCQGELVGRLKEHNVIEHVLLESRCYASTHSRHIEELLALEEENLEVSNDR